MSGRQFFLIRWLLFGSVVEYAKQHSPVTQESESGQISIGKDSSGQPAKTEGGQLGIPGLGGKDLKLSRPAERPFIGQFSAGVDWAREWVTQQVCRSKRQHHAGDLSAGRVTFPAAPVSLWPMGDAQSRFQSNK